MPSQDHYRKLENLMHSAPIVKLTRARALIGDGTAEITIPVREEFFHAAHALHGSIYFLALDNAAFFAVNSLVEDVFVLTASFTTYLTRPVTSGEIRAAGKVVSRGNSQFIAESVLYDEDGKEIGRGNGIFVKSRIALDERVGYTA
ncbi:MAG: PaaI family thioesterase [Spirochaetes bacterium]|nr:MAG: PaaI family thioesterase [Spirochaetota bacterium]